MEREVSSDASCDANERPCAHTRGAGHRYRRDEPRPGRGGGGVVTHDSRDLTPDGGETIDIQDFSGEDGKDARAGVGCVHHRVRDGR